MECNHIVYHTPTILHSLNTCRSFAMGLTRHCLRTVVRCATSSSVNTSTKGQLHVMAVLPHNSKVPARVVSDHSSSCMLVRASAGASAIFSCICMLGLPSACADDAHGAPSSTYPCHQAREIASSHLTIGFVVAWHSISVQSWPKCFCNAQKYIVRSS